MNKSALFIRDLFYFPPWGRGMFAVWQRNYLYFKCTIMMSFFWIVLEPLLYLGAIGFGVGSFVPSINGLPYAQFFAPALMTTSGMFISYFEGSFGSFTRFRHQKTYDTILLSPISPSELILGEILWAASKGFLSSLSISLVALGLGLVSWTYWFPAVCIQILVCWVFASFGLVMSSVAKNYDSFTYAQTGLIVPMALFGGTFFPLETLPFGIQQLAYVLPVTHGVMATRITLSGQAQSVLFINLAILFLMGSLLTNLAVARMNRKLFN